MNIWRKESLRQKVYSDLLSQLIRGDIAPGSPLPSCSQLQKKYRAGRETIKAVIAELAERRYIIRRDRRPALAAGKLPRKHYTIAIPFVEFPGHSFNEFNYENSPWSWMMYRATAEALLRRGHCAVLVPMGKDSIVPIPAHGIILLGANIGYWQQHIDLPMITLLSGDDTTPCTINLDRSQSMLNTATYFLANGVKSVLLMNYEPGFRRFVRTYLKEYFINTLLDNNMDERNIVDFNESRETTYASGIELVKKFIQLDLPRPWGILSPGDFQAKAAVDICIGMGLQPKKDFFVIGGTGLKECENWTPALSTFGTPYEELGEVAAETIIEYITTGVKPAPVLVKNKLTIRET